MLSMLNTKNVTYNYSTLNNNLAPNVEDRINKEVQCCRGLADKKSTILNMSIEQSDLGHAHNSAY